MEVLLTRLVNSSTFTLVQYIMGNQAHAIVAQMTHDKIQQESESSNGYHMHYRPTCSCTSIMHGSTYDGCTMYWTHECMLCEP